ncbi:hypothetical protein HELRODRAFT_192336 [Helobdella robusta]|uniref:EGF-like domain-containing protein n=1 Tax=Helobdella robusta TaxID=6412 RepID=T1FTU2_HELRO|nr:hypothetical protein HELRODRAFT_192336 [Helobdella robusta]ESO01432.1 hypothetical protein HELRODRAFT_192336 [Helobdella robusta]
MNEPLRCSCPADRYGRHCDFFNSCSSTPCLATRNCSLIDPSYTCPCTINSGNSRCETFATPCPSTSNICSNQGSCYINASSLSSYCVCSPGFSGVSCNVVVDPCSSNPCLNGGQCKGVDRKVDPTGRTCFCTVGFVGETCQLSVQSVCASNPCQFNSICSGLYDPVAKNLSYNCTCGQYLEGMNCGNCTYCLNGGKCYVEAGQLKCSCSSAGKFGVRCNETDPCASAPCPAGSICQSSADGRYACSNNVPLAAVTSTSKQQNRSSSSCNNNITSRNCSSRNKNDNSSYDNNDKNGGRYTNNNN